MHSVPDIRPNSIGTVKGLENRPIFFITFNGQSEPSLVVKGEAKKDDDSELSIKWGSKMMKNVNDTLVNTKIMQPQEITEFTAAVKAVFPPTSAQYKNAENKGYLWVKMPFVKGLTDADAQPKDKDGNYTVIVKEIKPLLQKFQDDKVWFDLGKVLAVDIFNGNQDRFTTDGNWQNQGNVMFKKDVTGTPKVIGLDTYDPNNGMNSNLVKGGGFEDLKILSDPMKMRNFATECTRSVGDQISRWMRKGNINYIWLKTSDNKTFKVTDEVAADMFVPYAADIEKGIVAGAKELKDYLTAKVRTYAATAKPTPPPVPSRDGRPQLPPTGQNRATPPPVPSRVGRPQLPPTGQARNTPPPVPSRDGRPQLPASGHFQGQPPSQPGKTIPQGILDRMKYLNWM